MFRLSYLVKSMCIMVLFSNCSNSMVSKIIPPISKQRKAIIDRNLSRNFSQHYRCRKMNPFSIGRGFFSSLSSFFQVFSSSSNEISVLKRSSSEVTISLINSVDSPCVICLTDPRQVLLLPCRHLCICSSCAENLKFQSANCPICRVPFRALLQLTALHHRKDFVRFQDDEEELIYENIPLIDALNLATAVSKQKNQPHLTTNDIKYFCSEQTVSPL